MKQFKNFEEMEKWIADHFALSVEEQLFGYDEEEHTNKIMQKLTEEGYDLDDLLEDGHAYQLGEHKNNGWLYEDETDSFTSANVEIRKR